MDSANPVGSSVHDAGEAIDKLGLLEQSNLPTEEQPTEEPAQQLDSEAEEPEQETPEAESKASEDTSADTDAGDDAGLELPDTLEALSEALGLEANGLDALKVNVKVNGATQEVTLADAVKGHQMEADYRHKTAELAEQKRGHEAEQQKLQEQWRQRFDSIQGLEDRLSELVGGSADLQRILDEEGTEAYTRAKIQHDVRQEALTHAKGERDKANQEAAQKQHGQIQAYLQGEQAKLAQSFPELSHPEKGPKIRTDMRTYLGGQGFSDGDIGGLIDHRMVLVVRDAMRYRALEKSKPATTKKLKALPKVLKPGAAGSGDQDKRDRGTALVQHAKKTGTVKDAARVFEHILR